MLTQSEIDATRAQAYLLKLLAEERQRARVLLDALEEIKITTDERSTEKIARAAMITYNKNKPI